MPSSTVCRFTDPDDYAASIRGAKTELTFVGRGDFEASITRIDFHRLWMQRLSENRARIMHSADAVGRAIVSFHTQPGPGMLRGGIELGSDSIARLAKSHDYFQRSTGPTRWGSMSLPLADMQSAGETIGGCDLTPLTDEVIVVPPPAAMAKLQRLHAEAGELAERDPGSLANPELARGLENALVHAMVDCLCIRPCAESSTAHHRHERIMRRFHGAIRERSEEAMYIPDICAAVGVPERTLRLCCYESLGMGPKRYLLVRRMQLARQALRKAAAGATSVTEIAANFGFWNFGRFAVEYKVLYGEGPSTTLRNPLP